MKKSSLLFLSFALVMGAAIGASSKTFKTLEGVNAEVGLISNTAEDWVKVAGSQEATPTQNGLKWTKFGGTWSASYYQDKVKVDGLSIKLYSYYEDNTSNSVFGLFFHSTVLTKLNTIDFNPVVNLWPNLYSGQTRWNISSTYDRSKSSSYLDETCLEKQNFTPAGTGISTSNVDHPYTGFTVTFTKVSDTAYKVEILDDFSGFWYSVTGTPGTGFDEGKTKYTAYVKASELDLDDKGFTYLYLFGSHVSQGNVQYYPTFYAENLKAQIDNGGLTEEEINGFKAEINAIDPTLYDPSLTEEINKIKSDALLKINSVKKATDANKIINEAKEAVDNLFKHYALFDQDFTKNDPGANFYCCWGGGSTAKRFNDEGGISVHLQNGYGNRSEFKRQYSITNFEMSINISLLPIQTYLIINAASKAQSYITEDSYFHLELGKDSKGQPYIIFGNTGSHNLSFEDFGTDVDGSYKGKNVKAPIHDYHIKMVSDKNTMKSTLTVNDITYTFDTKNILKNDTSKFDNKAYYTIGLMNANAFGYVLFEKMEDADSKNYASTLESTVSDIKNNIASLKAALPDPGDGLTSATFDAYNSAYETFLSGYNNEIKALMDYDVAHFEIDKMKEEAYAPIAEYSLKNYIDSKKNALNQYVSGLDKNDYASENWDKIVEFRDDALASLSMATSESNADSIYNEAIKKIDAVETSAIEELKNRKAIAKENLEKYVDLTEYDEEDQASISKLINDGKVSIEAATTVEDVDRILAAVKNNIDQFKTKAQKEAIKLEETKVAAKTELENYLLLSDYYEEQQLEIDTILTEAYSKINAAKTSDEVLVIKLNAETALDAILTKAQVEAKKLNDAKIQARQDIQNYVNLADYRSEEQTQIRNLILETRNEIDACKSIEEVNTVVNNFKALVDAKKTKAQYELEELNESKIDALAELESFMATVDMSKYSKENAAEINSKYSLAQDDINNATSIDAVIQVVTDFKAFVSTVPTKGLGCGGAIMPMSLIFVVSMLAFGGLVLRKKKDEGLYEEK